MIGQLLKKKLIFFSTTLEYHTEYRSNVNIDVSMFFRYCRKISKFYIDNLKMMTRTNICPMCKGSGYFDLNAVEEPISLETSNSSITQNCNIAAGNIWLTNDKNCSKSECTEIARNCETALDKSLENSEKNDNFHNTLKLAIQKLKENNWQSSISALIIIVEISRFSPKMIDSSMPIVMRSLLSLLKNVRHQTVTTACEIAEELFKTMQCTLKPEFDELVFALLQKTAHTNRLVRNAANKALDTMVVYIQPQHCIRVICATGGAGHKNAIVRTTASRLLYNIICTIGVETFLTSSNLRETRRKTFVISMQFLNDPSIETRCNARSLIELLMRHENFDTVFTQDVDRTLIKTYEKQLVSLKYKECKSVHAVEI